MKRLRSIRNHPLVGYGICGVFVFVVVRDSWDHVAVWKVALQVALLGVCIVLLGASEYLRGKMAVNTEWIAWMEEHAVLLRQTQQLRREVQRRVDALAGKFHGPS